LSIPLESVLGAALAIPAIVCLVSGEKDPVTRTLCISLVVIGALLALAPPIDPVENLLHDWKLVLPLEIAAGVLGIFACARIGNRVVRTLLVSAGSLLALRGVDLLGGWAL
jgi:hypothetical protein